MPRCAVDAVEPTFYVVGPRKTAHSDKTDTYNWISNICTPVQSAKQNDGLDGLTGYKENTPVRRRLQSASVGAAVPCFLAVGDKVSNTAMITSRRGDVPKTGRCSNAT